MRFKEYSHRYAKAIIMSDSELSKRYYELINVISSISDEELINDFHLKRQEHLNRKTNFKSITPSINSILKEKLLQIDGWKAEVDIFNDDKNLIGKTEWRLDFSCENALAVEVAFNHGEAIAWNLLKPVLSSELNHVRKAIQTRVGVYVCATNKLKIAGNIDSASGSYEKVLRYLPPLMNQLTTPIIIIGLDEFETFKINKKTREIEMLDISEEE